MGTTDFTTPLCRFVASPKGDDSIARDFPCSLSLA
jgi:hypothetical protein